MTACITVYLVAMTVFADEELSRRS